MFKKRKITVLSIFFSGILISSLFSLNIGSRVDVSASTTPDYLLGNVSLNNLTPTQTTEITDKVVNYTKTIVEKANGNLTKMSLLVTDDMTKRNIISENDKQELNSFISSLDQIKNTSNLTLINEEISSNLEGLTSNSSNPIMVALKSGLNHLTPSCDSIGVDLSTGVCILMSGNATGMPNDNLTLGNTGLPPMTIGSNDQPERFGKCLIEIGVGGITYGGIGAAIGLGQCLAQ